MLTRNYVSQGVGEAFQIPQLYCILTFPKLVFLKEIPEKKKYQIYGLDFRPTLYIYFIDLWHQWHTFVVALQICPLMIVTGIYRPIHTLQKLLPFAGSTKIFGRPVMKSYWIWFIPLICGLHPPRTIKIHDWNEFLMSTDKVTNI